MNKRRPLQILGLLPFAAVPLTAANAQAASPPPSAQTSPDVEELRAELRAAQQQIQLLSNRIDALSRQGQAPGPVTTAANAPPPLRPVGEAPEDQDRPPEIAVLGQEGALITRKGQLTAEFQADYTRADRNRALFRGIALLDTLLVGIFDINESHQDVVDASLGLRYGLSNRFEIGVRVPFVHRADSTVLAPVQLGTTDNNASTIANSARGNGLGDVETTLRYQLTRPSAGRTFLVANLQVVAPTGSDPFSIPRDDLGQELKAATGAGFWSIAPSLTAILPTDPALLFGSIGYTHNLSRNVNAIIAPVRLTHVDPGDSVSATAGIGLALNDRTSLNLGYQHSWTFGTRTTSEPIDPTSTQGPMTMRVRDLQVGRFLFGVTYRVSDKTSINWGVEVGATADAPDVQTTLRVPITLLSGR